MSKKNRYQSRRNRHRHQQNGELLPAILADIQIDTDHEVTIPRDDYDAMLIDAVRARAVRYYLESKASSYADTEILRLLLGMEVKHE